MMLFAKDLTPRHGGTEDTKFEDLTPRHGGTEGTKEFKFFIPSRHSRHSRHSRNSLTLLSPSPLKNFVPLCLCVSLFLLSCPSNPEAPGPLKEAAGSENTRRLYNYLADQYFNYIISGQMDTSWTTNKGLSNSSDMISRVHNDTGKYPAIKGFDLIQLPYPNSPYFAGREQIDEAIEWWEGKNNGVKLLPDQPDIHGIVVFCWHWRVTSNQFDTSRTSFRIPWDADANALDTSKAEFQTIKNDLDKVAALFQIMKDKAIPVLWRPLHEASGGWFWWGASGAKPYIALWEYMHDYLANVKGLDNLIWVWNGQNKDWFPNPATVDIVGYDYYPWPRETQAQLQNYNSQKATFINTEAMIKGENNLIVALTENAGIPDPDKCREDGAMWSWFMVWNDSKAEGVDDKENFWTGNFVNTQAHKEHVYNHDLVITLDELPDITQYRLEY